MSHKLGATAPEYTAELREHSRVSSPPSPFTVTHKAADGDYAISVSTCGTAAWPTSGVVNLRNSSNTVLAAFSKNGQTHLAIPDGVVHWTFDSATQPWPLLNLSVVET